MADIRNNTVPIDDFNRAPENPIQYPYATIDTAVWGGNRGKISSGGGGAFQGNPGDCMEYNQEVVNLEFGSDGIIEVWAHSGSGVDLSEAWRLGLGRASSFPGSNSWQGYQVRWIIAVGNNSVDIRRYPGPVDLAGDNTPGLVTPLALNDCLLFRRHGNDLEVWRSDDYPDHLTWTLKLTTTDTTYMDTLTPILGISTDDGGNPSWLDWGAGPDEELQQIYRRPTE